MNYLEKTLSVLLIIVLAISASAVMYGFIKGFFIGLLWLMNNPIMGMIISFAFLAGCFLGNVETKSNKSV
tara:strand:- start:177 stop:386 length:210 start_codon:yes stop_codon:yes gene_type:complete